MSWGKLDDGFHRHLKVQRCSLAARGLWATALSFTADLELDGFVPADVVPRLAEGHDWVPLVAELTRVAAPFTSPLWDVCEDGFRFHDYRDCNLSHAELQKLRKGWRIRKKRQRGSPAESHAVTPRVTPGRDGKGSSSLPSVRKGRVPGEPFAAFMAAYPRKEDRPQAKAVWGARHLNDQAETIMCGLAAWVAYWEYKAEPQYVPYAAKWLKGERWNVTPPVSEHWRTATPKTKGNIAAAQEAVALFHHKEDR